MRLVLRTLILMQHQHIDLTRIKLHAVSSGNGPLVLFLHGFPEFWYSWRHQLPAFAAAGYRALAVDLRGYNESEKPGEMPAYAAVEVVADIVQLLRHETASPACVVGHDWGGIIAWRLAALYPELVDKLVILNAPHPLVYARTLRTNFAQWLRSSYVGLFQIPGVAEAVLRAGNFWAIERGFRRASNPAAFTAADIERYKQALTVPGALTGGLNYYRAALWRPRSLFEQPQQVAAPTLVIWGERDPFLSVDLLRGLDRWAPRLRIERIKQASHWVQNEAPAEVNRLIIDFISRE